MPVHHFSAPDMVVARGWQPMDTFPRDGTMVEVTDGNAICKAQWMVDKWHMATQGISNPINWRYLETE